MCKGAISFILIFIFLSTVPSALCTMPKIFAASEILYVPTQYPTIQAAINSADHGDTIYVYNGTYNENVVVNKTISLIGENPLTTIIDGSGTGNSTVNVTVDNVKIEGFTIQKGEGYEPASLSIWDSRGHTIRNNIIRQSPRGLKIRESDDSTIINNVIANNTGKGILISNCRGTFIIGNLIIGNAEGVLISGSQLNTFYHNNFINNTSQVSDFGATKWDNGAEGNYWSDYSGQDLNGDGIGDTPHPRDSRPLIDKWSETRDFPTTGLPYHTAVRCNSTVASFTFTYSLAQISFNVTGPDKAVSFCNVTIDKSLLDGNFMVLVDRVSRSYILTQNITHASLYFTFSHSTRRIQIRGTKVVGNTIPTADFSYSPTEPREGQDIQFTDTSTDADGTVVARSWNFGDDITSSQQNPIYRYMKKGTYAVTLTVTDDKGAKNTITKTIVVILSQPDYTLYYVLAGIAGGTLVLGIAIFLLKKRKSSSKKMTR